MATTTVAKAYVDKVLVSKTGEPWALKTTEVHYRKSGDQYEVKGRTFRTVKAGYGVDIDFGQFGDGDQIEIYGKEESEEREYDGKKYSDLIIQAEGVNLIKKSERATPGDARMNVVAGLGAVEVDPYNTPF